MPTLFAGFEIALACDILLASPNAKFIDSHAKLGIIPSWGLSQKLPRIVGANVARWGCTSRIQWTHSLKPPVFNPCI